jgi:GAF domain-containing protein
MEIIDLRTSAEFAQRQHSSHNIVREIQAVQRLAHVFATHPRRILLELVSISMDLCAADSAGITIEELAPDGETQLRWLETAGIYAQFLGAVLPRGFSPCGTCLARSQPQLFRVSKLYLDTIGVDAPPVTDGLLIPWEVDQTRGTLWIIAHHSGSLFDSQDYRILQCLADFAAIAIRHHAQQQALTEQAAATAAANMANQLAHRINNPLQSLTNNVFLAAQGGADANAFARQASDDLIKLSALVSELLHLPTSY